MAKAGKGGSPANTPLSFAFSGLATTTGAAAAASVVGSPNKCRATISPTANGAAVISCGAAPVPECMGRGQNIQVQLASSQHKSTSSVKLVRFIHRLESQLAGHAKSDGSFSSAIFSVPLDRTQPNRNHSF